MQEPVDHTLIRAFLERVEGVGGGPDSTLALPISHQTLYNWRKGKLPAKLKKPIRQGLIEFLEAHSDGGAPLPEGAFAEGLEFAINHMEAALVSLKRIAAQSRLQDQGMDPAKLARHLSVNADQMRAFRAQMEERESAAAEDDGKSEAG